MSEKKVPVVRLNDAIQCPYCGRRGRVTRVTPPHNGQPRVDVHHESWWIVIRQGIEVERVMDACLHGEYVIRGGERTYDKNYKQPESSVRSKVIFTEYDLFDESEKERDLL